MAYTEKKDNRERDSVCRNKSNFKMKYKKFNI